MYIYFQLILVLPFWWDLSTCQLVITSTCRKKDLPCLSCDFCLVLSFLSCTSTNKTRQEMCRNTDVLRDQPMLVCQHVLLACMGTHSVSKHILQGIVCTGGMCMCAGQLKLASQPHSGLQLPAFSNVVGSPSCGASCSGQSGPHLRLIGCSHGGHWALHVGNSTGATSNPCGSWVLDI